MWKQGSFRAPGTTWSVIPNESGTGSRSLGGVAYDKDRQTLIIYGGLLGGQSSCPPDTWEWDGEAWQEIQPSHE